MCRAIEGRNISDTGGRPQERITRFSKVRGPGRRNTLLGVRVARRHLCMRRPGARVIATGSAKTAAKWLPFGLCSGASRWRLSPGPVQDPGSASGAASIAASFLRCNIARHRGLPDRGFPTAGAGRAKRGCVGPRRAAEPPPAQRAARRSRSGNAISAMASAPQAVIAAAVRNAAAAPSPCHTAPNSNAPGSNSAPVAR